MTAGLNLKGRIVRFTYPADDVDGGAVPIESTLYENILARIDADEPTLAILQQGLDTVETFSALLSPGNLDLRHNDQFEVTYPPMSPHYQKRFRVVGIMPTSMFDGRGYLVVTLRRVELGNSNALQ